MYLIGLTGGIASGKSTIAQRFAEQGAYIIDADRLARDAVAAGSPGLAEVIAHFGEQVLAADGSLDRAALGAIVFQDATARRQLEAIVHPEVQRLTQEQTAAIEARDPRAVIVYDIPLLVETNSTHPYDLVVVAQATPQRQRERLVAERGLEASAARARIAAQATDAERAARADVIIDTSQSLAHTLAQVDELWASVSGRT